jgi:hypothetical protein
MLLLLLIKAILGWAMGRSRLFLLSSAFGLIPVAAAAADQEVVPSMEVADTQIIVKTISDGIQGAYALGARPAHRDAHAKGHGCVKATFKVRGDIPTALKAGVFASPRTYTAWVRFSNGAGTPTMTPPAMAAAWRSSSPAYQGKSSSRAKSMHRPRIS